MRNFLFFYFVFYSSLSLSNINSSKVVITWQEKNLSKYYNALSSSDTLKINSELQSIKSSTSTLHKAYTGALLMKKSGLVKPANKKLAMFKEGMALLEESINTENENAEFRFLRLVIQEHCPAILRYHDNIKEDSMIVADNYKNFSPALKHAVADYAKISPSLKSTPINKAE